MTIPILFNFNPDKYNQEVSYYPFMVTLERCSKSYNTLDDPSGKIYVQNKT